MTAPAQNIAHLIDHTFLKPDATHADILKLCQEARTYRFATVCVNPYWVPTAAYNLTGSGVKICTVIGFPLGATTTPAKVAETETALHDGATEIDMVQNIGALRSGDLEAVHDDITAVVTKAHAAGAIVKVILETALLTDDQKVQACRIAQQSAADFVKTSTGFGPGGATVHDIELMRAAVGPHMGVKASGGIRTLEDLQKMVHAGATRIGASASVNIISSTQAHGTVSY